jgi:hypothetical protein
MLRPVRHPLLALASGAILAAAGSLAALHAAGVSPTTPWPAEVERAAASITAAELRASLRFLASDLLEGRGTGHPGNERAALYLATMLERLGLEPVAGGTFRQRLPLVTPRLGEPNRLEFREALAREERVTRLEFGRDFSPAVGSGSGEITAELAFVGYGVSAPETGYDDYADVDVRGRVVVAFMGQPRPAGATRPFDGHHARVARKVAVAAEKGAAALLLVPTSPRRALEGSRLAWPVAHSPRSARFALEDSIHEMPVVNVSGDAAWTLIASPSTPATSLDALETAVADAVKVPAAERWGAGPRLSFLVPGRRVMVSTTVIHEPVVGHNVLAMVAGADPQLRHELVVVGAHFDHDGIDDEGRIFNGADDDGSGTVGVIEIAEAFARAAAEGRRPRRTVVFALWNAEEKGLLGSRHYVDHVTPAGGVPVVKLNMDMIGRSEEVPERPDPRFHGLAPTRAADNANVLHLLGYSQSPDLADIVRAQNAAVGLTLRMEYDFHEQDLLRRSDQWPFLQKRVPAAYFTTGLHPDYHTPDDDVDRIDFAKMERIVRLVFRTAWHVANAETLPRYRAPTPSTDQ